MHDRTPELRGNTHSIPSDLSYYETVVRLLAQARLCSDRLGPLVYLPFTTDIIARLPCPESLTAPGYRVEPAQLRSALQALARLAADPQLLVDFFVNYDCDLQVPQGVPLL